MTRFLLSPGAKQDLNSLSEYLRGLPGKPALKIARTIQNTLHELAINPRLGVVDQQLSRQAAEEFRRFAQGDYVFIYAAERRPVEFFAVLHGKRDVRAITRQRLR